MTRSAPRRAARTTFDVHAEVVRQPGAHPGEIRRPGSAVRAPCRCRYCHNASFRIAGLTPASTDAEPSAYAYPRPRPLTAPAYAGRRSQQKGPRHAALHRTGAAPTCSRSTMSSADEERLVRDTVRKFAADRIMPHIADWFEAGTLPTTCSPS